ncbi:MAG: hypothetical protein II453_18745, partial [Alphaproteobacteria bacterium]|nr:hypothetical protein [Alphaproteobacteria bacterium]
MKSILKIVVFLFPLILLVNCRNNSTDKEFFFDGEYPPVEVITIIEDGETYEIQAVSGQCIVFFHDDASWANAKLVIERNGGRIIEQMPDFNYYLVSVKAGRENNFIDRMKNEDPVEYVFLNTINEEKSEVFIIDHFTSVRPDLLTSHGNAVKMTFNKYGVSSSLHIIDMDKYSLMEAVADWATSLVSSDNYLIRQLTKAILQVPNNQIGLVNISLGVSGFGKRLYSDVSNSRKLSYKKEYEEHLKVYSVCFNKLRKRGYSNFLVSRSSGNEGMHEMELIFNKLSKEAMLSLEKNMVLVNSYDTKKERWYSNNTMSKHPFTTTIDVSSEPWSGTSLAAPKLLGFVDRICAKYKTLSAQEILVAIRNATPCDTKQPMTYEMLEREAAKLVETRGQSKQYTFTLNMTSDYRGEWDLSEGEGQDVV